VSWLIIIAPTQSGKTVFLQVAVADSIDQDPGPLLYLLPDKNSADKMIKEKVIDVIKSTPELASHMTGKVADVSKKGIHLDNMVIYPAWAGSLATMSSLPMKRVVLDEARLMKLTIGVESNAIKLSGDRMTTYADHRVAQGYIVSSASIEGDLLHGQLSVPGTVVLHFYSRCPHCREYQILSAFKNLRYNKDKDRAECLCIHCKGEFTDSDRKVSWNIHGVYAPKGARIYKDGSLEVPLEKHDRIVFRYTSMVSPFRSFEKIYKEWQQTKGQIHNFKNFIQCWEADFWIDDISTTDSLKLKEHYKDYLRREVPSGVRVVTCGCDVQDSGFYFSVWGHGINKHCWLIDSFFIPCHVDSATKEEVKKIFEEVLSRVYRNKDSVAWKIALLPLDTGGHRTKEIYAATQEIKKIAWVKGHNNQSSTIQFNRDLSLYSVRTCEYLEETELRCDTGFWHLPKDCTDDYLEQFCNIRKVKDKNKKTGVETVIWKKIGQCDYRFSDVHAFIALDIPTDAGMFRNELDKEGWRYNPAAVVEVKKVKEDKEEDYEDEEENIEEAEFLSSDYDY
jgi:phage terminase large subunit GpA-like protein